MQFFPIVFLTVLTGTAFPLPAMGAAEAGNECRRDSSIKFPHHLVASHQLVLTEHILNHPQYFMTIILRGYFLITGHSLQMVFPSWIS